MLRTLNTRLILALLSGLALAVVAGRAEESSLMRAALESIHAAELDSHVHVLADDRLEGRQPGTAGGREAGVYLMKELKSRGLVPAGNRQGDDFFQTFGRRYRNILGLWEGSDPELKDEYVIVGAHYDHVGYGNRRNSRGGVGRIHNGADDNASGTAAVLEAVDAVGQLVQRPRRSLLFAFWDGEEMGLLGSKHWVAHPTVPLRNVAATINLDMVGRLRDERLQVIGTRSTLGMRQLVSRQNVDLGLHLEFPWDVKAKSDHSSFFDYGVPVVMFHTGLHDDYHTPRDDADLLNPEGMQQVTRLLFRVAWELADRTDRPAFRMAARRENDASRRKLEQPLPPPPPRLGVYWKANEEERQRAGLLITKVATGSAAESAGLLAGDRIVAFDGREVTDETQFRQSIVTASNPVKVLVERADEAEPVGLDVQLSGDPVRVGIAWREDPAEPETVFLVQVMPGSPADLAGLKVGDRIYEIGGQTFADSDAFLALINSLPGSLELLVERGGRIIKIQVEVDSPPGLAGA